MILILRKTKKNILITHNKQEVKNIMSNYVGIVRSNDCLQRAEKDCIIYIKKLKTSIKSLHFQKICMNFVI